MRHPEELLSAYADGELPQDKRREVEEHLKICEHCRRELEKLKKLEGIMGKIKVKDLEEELWRVYWKSVYNRIERGVGWILFSLGMIILLSWGGIELLKSVFSDTTIPLLVKIGVVSTVVGLVVLLVSVVRERIWISRDDKYSREVEK